MKDKIIRNLHLKVDWQKAKVAGMQFYSFHLIGILPVLITYTGNKKEIARLQAKEPIRSDDPSLRNLVGAKAIDQEKTEKYREQINKLVVTLEKAVRKAKESEKWRGYAIEDIALIKF